jgi:hypothetical protein
VLPLAALSPAYILFGACAVTASIVAGEFRARPRRKVPLWITFPGAALFSFMAIADVLTGFKVHATLFLALTGLLAVWSVRSFEREDLEQLVRYLGWLLTIHVVAAAAELFAHAKPLWLADEYPLSARPNQLLKFFPGRPMTSFGEPIPMGAFGAVSGVIAAALWNRRTPVQSIYVTAAGLVLVVLSGTRSTLGLMLLALLAILVVRWRARIAVKLSLVAVLGVAAWFTGTFNLAIRALGIGDEFVGSSSYRQRMGVIQSLPSLLDAPPVNVIFGHGVDRQAIFKSGIVHSYLPGAYFFDNQYIAMLAMYGLLGLGLFLLAIVFVLVRGNLMTRIVVLLFAGLSMSFDFLGYWVTVLLFAFAIGLPAAAARPGPTPDDHGGSAPVLSPAARLRRTFARSLGLSD